MKIVSESSAVNDALSQIRFANKVGIVIENYLLLTPFNQCPIEISEIRRVDLIKTNSKRNRTAIFIFVAASSICLMQFHWENWQMLSFEFLCVLSIVKLLLIKDKYVFFLKKSNLEHVEINVGDDYKNDAKMLAFYIDSNLKRWKD